FSYIVVQYLRVCFVLFFFFFFFSSRRRHTRWPRDWSSDVCSSDLARVDHRVGLFVVCEKPLCITLEEADAMIDACAKAGVLLLYAEELFFAPKYVKAKQMADEGAFGRIHLVKQSEKHSGPHSEWVWDVEQSGGGALMDLGCHGIAFCWWFLGKPKIVSVYSQMATQVHH